MLEPRIQQHFFESADLLYQVAENLSRPLADAAQVAVACLTSGGKLLAGGTGGAQMLAQLMCSVLMTRMERERPALAAVALSGHHSLAPYPAEGLGSVEHELGLAQQLGQGLCGAVGQQIGAGRRADLVGHHAQLLALGDLAVPDHVTPQIVCDRRRPR